MKKILALLIVLAIALIPLTIVFAQSPNQSTPPADWFTVAVQLFEALVGFPAALAGILTLAMRFGLTADLAHKISFGVNLLAFIGVAYLVFSGQTSLVTMIDSALNGFAKILADLVVVLGAPAITYLLTGRFAVGMANVPSNFRAARSYLAPSIPPKI